LSYQLSGFNNLTKSLRVNLFEFYLAQQSKDRQAFRRHIASTYSAQVLSTVLREVSLCIDANVLATSDQDYQPWGASSMVLMGEGVSAHLDKSHVCAHTFPDIDEASGVCSIRIDIDIATCGVITPLSALQYLFDRFSVDAAVIDYTVRGFTRVVSGERIFIDHKFHSLQEFLSDTVTEEFTAVDLNLPQANIWQTKLVRSSLHQDFRELVNG
jgi:S-adenosylmethionine decarboxylase